MARLTVEIAADNAAFEGESLPHELNSILQRVAYWSLFQAPLDEDELRVMLLRDSNGNSVGKAELSA